MQFRLMQWSRNHVNNFSNSPNTVNEFNSIDFCHIGWYGWGQTGASSTILVSHMRKPFVWAGHRGFFSHRELYFYLFTFKDVSF